MPEPRPNEDKKNYIRRCMAHVVKEGKSQRQAAGQCYGIWDHMKKKARRRANAG